VGAVYFMKCKVWADGTKRRHPNKNTLRRWSTFSRGLLFVERESRKVSQRFYHQYHRQRVVDEREQRKGLR